MRSRDCSTAIRWYRSISAGSVRLKTAPTGLRASPVVDLPVGEQRELVELLLERHLAGSARRSAAPSRGLRSLRPACSARRSRVASTATTPLAAAALSSDRRDRRPRPNVPVDPWPTSSVDGAIPRARRATDSNDTVRSADEALEGRRVVRVDPFAALVALLMLVPAASAAAGRHGDGELREYAQRTWASFAAMTDPASGLPADILESDGTTASRRRRRTSARTCGAPSPRGGSASSRERELVGAAVAHAHDARAHGALRRHGPVLQLVRPPHRREADRLAAAPASTSSTRSSRRSTTAGSPSA